MSIKVNGINYGWGDVDVKIPGLNLVVQEISYDDEQEMEDYCKATGKPFYGVELPSVVVSYGNPGGRTRIDELKRVVFVKRSHKAAQGDKTLTVDIDLMIVGGVVEDGVEPV